MLGHRCQTVPKDKLHLPGPDFVDRVHRVSDRNIQVLRNLQRIFDHGRLAGSGYLSIKTSNIPAAARSRPTRTTSTPANIVRLAIEGGCNAVASTLGVLGAVARQYAHKIPFIVLTRYQVVNCYLGRAGLINSGGASGENDLAQAVRTAVINKRAGGIGLISGRKAFQRPLKDGVQLLRAIQDVYLETGVTVA